MPERLGEASLEQATGKVRTVERSHFAPLAYIARLNPSDLWGVGYRLLADALPERRTA